MTPKSQAVAFPESGPSIASEDAIESPAESSEVTHQKNDLISSAKVALNPTQATNSALEDLPAEIRCIILEKLDYPSLLTLAHTSPVFYQLYRLHRTPLLRACLQKALGVTVVDAAAAYRSSLGVFAQERNTEEITRFLDTAWGGPPSKLTDSEVRDVSLLHFTVMEPLLERFMAWSLGNIAANTEITKLPSITERGRILRAMYRFATCYNLFHGCGCYDAHPAVPEYIDIIRLFFSLFEPWEVEQIVCVDAWVKGELHSFEDTQSDAWLGSPALGELWRPPSLLDLPFYFNPTSEMNNGLKGTAMCVFKLVYTALFKSEECEHLLPTMQHNIYWVNHLLTGTLGERIQWVRRNERPSAQDLRVEAGELQPFVGDLEPGSFESNTSPPLAWTWLCDGVYHNGYGDSFGTEMRQLGCVMWDEGRFREQVAGTGIEL